jgi:GH24 family phage-related lysozyme (muramidase)
MKMISERAKKLILDFEGMDQPGKWPGGESGITLGHGYDLGYMVEFEEDWRCYLPPEQIERLKTALWVRGQKAKDLAPSFSDIKIRVQDADEVFVNKTLPKFEEMTLNAFPGCEHFPEDVFGALVALVYNRGADTSNTDRRREMYKIKCIILALYKEGKVPTQEDQNSGLQAVADQILSMRRLWENKGLDGLLRRREAEADLIESCIS